jgi:very-short-patch-repair endonuclease
MSLSGDVLRDGKFARFGMLMDRSWKSFIERRFIEGLLMSEMFSFEPMDPEAQLVARDEFGIVLGYQVAVGPYFLDFSLTHPAAPLRLAIELDGHAWHRRTAEEAQYEAQRERFIVDAGYTVVRYMGAEVMRGPKRVANDAYRRIFNVVEKGPGVARTSPIGSPAHRRADEVRAHRAVPCRKKQ